jgi:monoamine oxidase
MQILSREMINALKMSTCTSAPALPTSRVIVVGSGLAGLSAATQLTKQNVPVILLDRAERPGGDSIKASRG